VKLLEIDVNGRRSNGRVNAIRIQVSVSSQHAPKVQFIGVSRIAKIVLGFDGLNLV
jgi:hypothetical protein